MLRDVQAPGGRAPNESSTCLARLFLAAAVALPLAACASGGVDMAKVDASVQTSSTGAPAPDPTRVSDSATIRNAVSAADIEAMNGAPLAWANPDTGSRGQISALAEKKGTGVLCRTFTASRESYDGVGLYKGETCLDSRGSWRMQEFKPL